MLGDNVARDGKRCRLLPADGIAHSAARCSKRYPKAREIFITADAGGSNGYRLHAWKAELQRLADKLQLSIHVSHFPPGTSKWNKIEHRLFSFITMNRRGRPLRSYETVVKLIGNTTTIMGLVVRARLDRRRYAIGKKVSAKDIRSLNIERDDFHGYWNGCGSHPDHAARTARRRGRSVRSMPRSQRSLSASARSWMT